MRLPYILLFVSALLLTSATKAQNHGFEWAGSIDVSYTGSFAGGSLAVTNDGQSNHYTYGSFADIIDYDPSMAASYDTSTLGGQNGFVQKVDANGNLIWGKSFGNRIITSNGGITIDANNNIYVTGSFQSTADFDPGAGVFNLTTTLVGSSYAYHTFILKLDSSGNFIWAKMLAGNDLNRGHDIKYDGYGGLIISGIFKGTTDFDPNSGTFNMTTPSSSFISDTYFLKLDTVGNFIWAKELDANNTATYENKLVVDSNGGFCVTGHFKNTIDFDPGAGVFSMSSFTTSFEDIFILRLDSSGSFVWAKRIGAADRDYAEDIVFDVAGNILITGGFQNLVDFDPNAGVSILSSISSSYDAFILKLDSQGNFIWVKQLGGSLDEVSKSIACDSLGSIYTVGYTNSFYPPYVDFDPNAGVYNPQLDTLSTSSYLHKLDSVGNFKWVKVISHANSSAYYQHLLLGSQQNIYVSGSFRDSIDCNPGFGINKVYNQWGLTDGNVFITKFSPCSVSTSATINDTACYSYTSPSTLYTWASSGTYYDTIPGSNSCDSLLTINLTILGSTYDTISPHVCNVSYTSPSANYSWSTSGTYMDTIPNSNGCDSVLTIHLTVGVNSFNTISEYVCTSYTSPSNNYTWTSTGIYNDTLTNSQGCDSILTVNLEVHDASAGISNDTLFSNSPLSSHQWLDCNNNYAIISGATNELFIPSVSGSYAVEVTQNGCVDTSACIPFIVSSVNEYYDNKVVIYPNPTHNTIFIALNQGSENIDFQLLNTQGSVLQSNTLKNVKEFAVDLSTLSTGIYYLRIRSASWVKNVKIEKY